MRYLLLAIVLLPSMAHAQKVGLATQYGHKGDKWAGQVFACYFKDGKVVRSHRKGAVVKKMDPEVFGIAHRSLPCGTMVRVCRLKKENGKRLCVVAPVVDRGPYWVVPKECMPGKIPPHSCWVKGKSSRGFSVKEAARRGYLPNEDYKHANVVDLLPRVSRSIRLGGRAAVTVEPLTMGARQARTVAHDKHPDRQQLQGGGDTVPAFLPPPHQGRDGD